MRVLRVLKAAGDVAEIVIAASIIIDVVKQLRFRQHPLLLLKLLILSFLFSPILNC